MFGRKKKLKEFIKYDQGKIRYELLYGKFIEGVAEVLTFGSVKYTKDGIDGGDNWHKCTSMKRYFGALLRHLWAYWFHREDLDPETGRDHLFHAGCCLMFIYGIKDIHGDIADDRPKGTNAKSVHKDKK